MLRRGIDIKISDAEVDLLVSKSAATTRDQAREDAQMSDHPDERRAQKGQARHAFSRQILALTAELETLALAKKALFPEVLL